MQVAFSTVAIFVRSRQKRFLRNRGLVNRKDGYLCEPFSRLFFKNPFRKCRTCSESPHQMQAVFEWELSPCLYLGFLFIYLSSSGSLNTRIQLQLTHLLVKLCVIGSAEYILGSCQAQDPVTVVQLMSEVKCLFKGIQMSGL